MKARYIKHKNMKDVCGEILYHKRNFLKDHLTFKVLWINLRGTYDHPTPFPMGSSSKLAIETIKIKSENILDWKIFNSVEDAKNDSRTVKTST